MPCLFPITFFTMKEEYVCQMPFDVDTANIGLRWWACQALQNFTGNGEGVEWAVNEPWALRTGVADF